MTVNKKPHAVDAERNVLGALLINNDLYMQCEGMLSPEFFYDQKHVLLYRVMSEMYGKGYVDPVLLAQRLADSGQLADVGGKDYIADIAAIPVAAINFAAYVGLIRDKALLRMMIRALSDSANEAFSPASKTPQKLLDEAEARLSAVGETFQREYGGGEQVADIARVYFDKISEIVASKNYDALRGVPSGYSKLDSMTNGLHGGDLVIVAGRPGSGKTAFALNIMRHVSATNNGVACFSLEMSAEQLTIRMLAHAGIELQKMRSGRNLGAMELSKMAHSVAELEKREICIESSGTMNILEVRTHSRRIHREMERKGGRLGLIVVDYLQLMVSAPGEKSENRSLEIAHISRGLKALAKELNVPVIALSQLNRNLENRLQKRPMLADLRDSGAIEQDADLILFLNYDDNNTEDSNRVRVELIVGKHRNGAVGTIPLHFDKPFSKFTDIADDGVVAVYGEEAARGDAAMEGF